MFTETDRIRLLETIADSRIARDQGRFPFAAQIVARDGTVLARVINSVHADCDPTAHAEVTAVRAAAKRLGRTDGLAGATIYASGEPCAMCAGAIHWAGLSRLVFAVGEERLARLYDNDPRLVPLRITARQVLHWTGAQVDVLGPCLEEEGALVHEGFWRHAHAEQA